MKFLKIHIQKKDENIYQLSIAPKDKYEVYFTDEQGFEIAKKIEGNEVMFSVLPKPLLKQIK